MLVQRKDGSLIETKDNNIVNCVLPCFQKQKEKTEEYLKALVVLINSLIRNNQYENASRVIIDGLGAITLANILEILTDEETNMWDKKLRHINFKHEEISKMSNM